MYAIRSYYGSGADLVTKACAAAPVAKAPAPPAAAPASPVRLLLSWARRLQSLGRLCSPGLAFDRNNFV